MVKAKQKPDTKVPEQQSVSLNDVLGAIKGLTEGIKANQEQIKTVNDNATRQIETLNTNQKRLFEAMQKQAQQKPNIVDQVMQILNLAEKFGVPDLIKGMVQPAPQPQEMQAASEGYSKEEMEYYTRVRDENRMMQSRWMEAMIKKQELEVERMQKLLGSDFGGGQ